LNFDEIDQSIKNGVDYVVDWERDDKKVKKSSTLMKLEPNGLFSFIRK